MTETFARAQKELDPAREHVRMVSISIDPETDRPAVLRNYALGYRAGSDWHFLTGARADIERVERAFGTWHANKMDHAALVFMRVGPDRPWTRIEGLMGAPTLLREIRAQLR